MRYIVKTAGIIRNTSEKGVIMKTQVLFCRNTLSGDISGLCSLYRQGGAYARLLPLSRRIDGACAALMQAELNAQHTAHTAHEKSRKA